MSTEYLYIPKCPKCNDGHRYKISVKRSIIMKILNVENCNDQKRPVKVTRLFTCPVKDEEFQAKFVLHNTFFEQINEVTVIGISHDEE